MTKVYVLTERSRFPFGELYVTTPADEAIERSDISKALGRHAKGDWGDVSDSVRAENDRALVEGNRLHSVYHDRNSVEFWVITEWDRSATTVLLPDDY